MAILTHSLMTHKDFPIIRLFFPIFQGRALGGRNLYFSLFFAYFGPEARNLFCSRPTGSQNKNVVGWVCFFVSLSCEPPTSYRSLSGSPGLKSKTNLKKVSWYLRFCGPKKSGTSLQEVRKVWKRKSRNVCSRLFRTFPWDASGAFRPPNSFTIPADMITK